MSEAVRIGVLGRGTVGGAFCDLVLERADAVEATTGRRPEIAGILRRSEGDFDAILESSDIIVELIGGTDPAREYVLRALEAGRHVVSANKQLIAQYGDELFDAARREGVQLRFEAAVAGVVPVIRVIQESLAATEITKVFGIVNGTTNFILSEMASTGATYADALARAQELGYAEADPSDDVGGADAAAKLSLKLLGVAERRDGGISVRVFPCFLYSHHPLAPVEGPFNAVMVEAPAISEITMSGPGAGGVETASAVLGDVVSIVSGRAPVHAAHQRFEIVRDISSAFYLHLEVADRPGVLANIADVLGRNEVSVRSVVQRGLGNDARLVMVMHEGPESKFFTALEEIATLEFLRAQPRAIRVIEEEWV